MTGYQGWFRAKGDGSRHPWKHYQRGGKFEPGSCSIELWPDLNGFDADELYPTPFRHAHGQIANVFSSLNRKTVIRHFEWMRDYGIDGAFVQRFQVETRDPETAQVLAHCREAANRAGRVYAVMYDTNFGVESLAEVRADWKRLVDHLEITSDAAYLHHEGKPVVALWGCGFKHYDWDAAAARETLDFFQNDLKYGNLSVMLGVPTHWMKLEGDCRPDPSVHEVIAQADVISPWMVGRTRTPDEAAKNGLKFWKPEIEWCREREIDYLPVVFPGFGWSNLKPGTESSGIPRLGGRFLWSQFLAAREAGASMVYTAMFDEIDEGTAIFKCTNDPPVGASRFLTYEGLPSDRYLKITGEGGRLIRGEIEPGQAQNEIPTVK